MTLVLYDTFFQQQFDEKLEYIKTAAVLNLWLNSIVQVHLHMLLKEQFLLHLWPVFAGLILLLTEMCTKPTRLINWYLQDFLVIGQ